MLVCLLPEKETNKVLLNKESYMIEGMKNVNSSQRKYNISVKRLFLC